MSEPRREAQRVFLDANVIYGQLTNDIVLSIADRKIIDPALVRSGAR